jgi:hypothetical protein
MKSIILSNDQFNSLQQSIESIRATLADPKKSAAEKYLDNQEFIILMKISKRTAQTWRLNGTIAYSQIGNKVYYRLADVEALLQKHYFQAVKGN